MDFKQFPWILYLLIIGLKTIEGEWTHTAEKDARSAVFTGYDRLVRPSSPVFLQVGLHLLTINNLDIKSQTLSLTGWISAQWEDPRLVWSTATYETENVFAYDTEIWKPELFVDNALDSVTILNDPYLQFRVENTGTVEWELPRIFVSHCNVDVQYFPFDKQVCKVELTSWAYAVEELHINPLYEEVQTEELEKNGEWTIVSTRVETRNFTELKPSGVERDFSVIDFQITIKRDPSHYISATILPILATSILSILVFILPVDSGEKVGYTLTVLLAEAVLLTLVQDSMPASSQHTSYLSVYLASTLILGVICVILTVLVIRVHHRSPNIPVPKWITALMMKFCIPIACWNGCCCSGRKSNAKIRPNSSGTQRYADDDDLQFGDFPTDHLFAWTEIAAILDWFFFVLMSTITALVSVILMLIVIIGGSIN